MRERKKHLRTIVHHLIFQPFLLADLSQTFCGITKEIYFMIRKYFKPKLGVVPINVKVLCTDLIPSFWWLSSGLAPYFAHSSEKYSRRKMVMIQMITKMVYTCTNSTIIIIIANTHHSITNFLYTCVSFKHIGH